MRLPWPAVAGGTLAVALGAAGLIRGAVPQTASAAPSAPGAVTVAGAYVRAPVPPTRVAAAYFTVYNTTSKADRLLSVATGIGATSVLHVDRRGTMSAMGDVVIPAHGKLVLSTGTGHVMISQLFGTVSAGQTVDIEVTFQTAGAIDVTAPVIAVGTAPPTSVPSGAHS